MAALDTSFLIDLARGSDAAHAALHVLVEDQDRIVVPAQVAIEYLVGLEDPVAGFSDLKGSFEILEVTEDQILEAGRLGREAHQDGSFPGWADLQIGATARLGGHEIVTADPGNFGSLGCRTWDYREEARHSGNAD